MFWLGEDKGQRETTLMNKFSSEIPMKRICCPSTRRIYFVWDWRDNRDMIVYLEREFKIIKFYLKQLGYRGIILNEWIWKISRQQARVLKKWTKGTSWGVAIASPKHLASRHSLVVLRPESRPNACNLTHL